MDLSTLVALTSRQPFLSMHSPCSVPTQTEIWPATCKKLCLYSCEEFHYNITSNVLDWPHPAIQLAFYKTYLENTSLSDKFLIYDQIRAIAVTNFTEAYQLLTRTNLLEMNFVQMMVKYRKLTMMRYVDREALSLLYVFGAISSMLNLWVGITFLTCLELVELVYHLLAFWSTCKKMDKENPCVMSL